MATVVHEPTPALGLDRQKLCVLGLIALALGVGSAAGLPFAGSAPLLPGVPLPWWALTLGFLATEHFVLHIQVRREAHTLSLAELPLVLGLFFAAPLELLGGRLLASLLTHLIMRRARPLKGAFNLALAVLETGVALALFRLLTPEDAGTGPMSWAAAYVGALTADALSALAVAAVIALHDGGGNVRAALLEAVLQPMPAVAVTTSLLAVVSLSASPASAPLVLVFAALLLVSFRAYASLAERHLNLERLYRFSQAVSTGPEVDDVMSSVLAEAKALLRAEQAAAAFLPTDGGAVTRIRLDSGGRLVRSEEPAAAEDAWLVRQVIDRGTPVLLPRTTTDPDACAWLSAHGLREAVVVPLTGGVDVAGVLVVGDRLGVIRTFEHDDVLLLETVANHSGVALRNSELIAQLRHDARHDALTGLPNRADLQRRLSTALADVSAGRAPGAAVMILDLDEFKAVNDTLGHHQGDQLLVEVAARLASAVGSAGTVARLGGDEFAVLVTGTADEDRVLRIGRRVLRALEQPIALDGLEVEVGGSVGIALAPAHASDPAVLLKRADLAMYDAKASSRSLRIYEPELHTDSPRRLTLVSELRSALQNGTVDVHVQPKARVGTGEIVAVEALVRWEHPELGWVPPDEFVPVAERSGLIGLLTSRVLDVSLAACAQWRAAGWDVGVAVNLSARSLQDADLVEEVDRLLRRHGVPADRLTLEVTEGSVMADAARAVALLHQLRDLGVRLSVDDFGTGYSSLSYLQRLPVHEVKIDRSFVTGLGREGENLVIVRAIVDLGHHLGLEVVAEGVEDQATSDLLASMRCDLVQGWHLARPMPTGDLVGWLGSHRTGGSLRVVRPASP